MISTILLPGINPKNVSIVVITLASLRLFLSGFNANSPKQLPEPNRTISFSTNSPSSSGTPGTPSIALQRTKKTTI